MTGFSLVSLALVAACVTLVTCAPAIWKTDQDSNTTAIADLPMDEIDVLKLNSDETGKDNVQPRNATRIDLEEEFRRDSAAAEKDERYLTKESQGSKTSLDDNIALHSPRGDNDANTSELSHSEPEIFYPSNATEIFVESGNSSTESELNQTSTEIMKEDLLKHSPSIDGGQTTENQALLQNQQQGDSSEEKKDLGNRDFEMSSVPEIEMIEEDYGITEQRTRPDMRIAHTNTDQLLFTSEGSPESDAMTLSDDVIIDALFTNLDILQDNIEMCEEGLRQKLSLISSTPLQTYTTEQVSRIISGSMDDSADDSNRDTGTGEADTKNRNDVLDGTIERVSEDETTERVSEDETTERVSEDETTERVSIEHTDDGREGKEEEDDDDDTDDEEDEDDLGEKDTTVLGTNHTGILYDATENGSLSQGNASSSTFRRDPQSQRGNHDSDTSRSKSRRPLLQPSLSPEPATPRERRSTGDQRENAIPHHAQSDLPLSSTTTGKLSHNQASHNVVMRLSKRLHYLKESLEQCYILYKQLSSTRFPAQVSS